MLDKGIDNDKGLENVPLSDLIQMDSTYLDRIKLRREITNTHPEATLACNAVAEDAAMELCTWLVEVYLPKRFPTCFAVVPSAEQSSHSEKPQTPHRHLLNKITSETVPLQPTDGLTGLRTLISHVDTDFLILLPRQHSPDNSDSQEPLQPVYHLEAFATTFPSGFSTRSKLSLPLAAIHGPVPRYASKIGKSMDRFFARMETGKMVRRANWTITTTPDLFTQSGTHMSDPDATPEEQAEAIAQQQQDLDISSMRLRTELQTLHRLPVTGALVFAFKTYQYTLEEVKAEGNGEALAEATEGFLKGSVPEMEVYKRVAVWGGKVREYLRS